MDEERREELKKFYEECVRPHRQKVTKLGDGSCWCSICFLSNVAIDPEGTAETLSAAGIDPKEVIPVSDEVATRTVIVKSKKKGIEVKFTIRGRYLKTRVLSFPDSLRGIGNLARYAVPGNGTFEVRSSATPEMNSPILYLRGTERSMDEQQVSYKYGSFATAELAMSAWGRAIASIDA